MHDTSLTMTPELALRLVREAQDMDRASLARLREERLHALLAYARAHSPLLREKYRHLPEKPALRDIPVLERAEGAANFDAWMCDREVTSRGLDAFLATPESMGGDFLGRYRVLSTSGSTAAPLRLVRDARHNLIHAALMQSRFWGGSKLGAVEGLKHPWPRACAITAGGGHHSSYLSFLRMARAYEARGLGGRVAFYPVETPIPRLVEGLNALQPEIVGTYPSVLQILARAQQAKQLAIRPLALCSSAEYLAPAVLTLLEEVFQCPVMDNYCSTEGGEAAMLCSANHLHVNSDWVVMEPVDAHNRPVREGLSDGILLTNLANLVQPVIRYRISDRAMLRYDPCPCGSPFPILEMEGRKEDTLEFAGEDGPFLLSPPVLMIASLHVRGCVASQFIQRSPEDLEVRCEVLTHADRHAVLAALLAETRRIFRENRAANVRLHMADAPLLRGKSGKLRVFIKDFD